MSKVLPLITGARRGSVDAVGKVLQALGVSVKPVDVASASASDGNVFLAGPLSKCEIATLGKKLGTPLHTSVTATALPASLNPDPTYADAKFTVVRANVPDPEEAAIPYKERVDRFARNGISNAKEMAYVKDLAAKTAALACATAQEQRAVKVTVLQKPLTALKNINQIFLDAVKAAAAKAVTKEAPTGLSVEVATSTQAVNAAVMFSKTLGVVVVPDYAAADTFEGVAVGVGGGGGLVAQSHRGDGKSVHAQACPEASGKYDPAANPTGALVAAAGALREMGATGEADKLEGALKKVYSSKSVLPSGVQGGKADAAAFADAVAKAL
eukprot:TRINITY_DN4229_c0_g1_i1.p2 TRINITY_DN4229_c0_g1~~TRINITY_DN4229_c0_g1_i1.p2  ORF type:complete len:327 (+),score=122.41 TRINITY_DN4229_c0_g1_i1:82-1062(+)